MRPVDVPWQVCPATPFLHLEISEEPQTARVTFAAHYGPISPSVGAPSLVSRIAAGFSQVQIVSRPGRFRPHGGKEPVYGYHRVRAVFRDAIEATFRAIGKRDDSAYDWSELPIQLEQVGVDRYVEKFWEMWVETSRCPDPRLYEVLGVADEGFRRWLICGEDAEVEVVAMGWEWQLGQPLRGW